MSEKSDDIFSALTRISANEMRSKNNSVYNEAKPIINNNTQQQSIMNTQLISNAKQPRQSRFYARQPIRPRERVQEIDPDTINDPDDQIMSIANRLYNELNRDEYTKALSFSTLWSDGIVDENYKMYDEVKQKLRQLDTDKLLDYIAMLLSAIR